MNKRPRGKSAGHGRRPSGFRLAAVALTGVLSLLIWQRLRLVTDTPRSVYAEPRTDEGARPAPPTDERPERAPRDAAAD
ncbi:MAG TPA: hypothetical protein PLU35_08765 [Phycisphaerales bacterium]|nr:hypothetical protein [Phycisphaerales bacterium]